MFAMRGRRPPDPRCCAAGRERPESALVAKLIGGLRGRAADDRRIQFERIGEPEVDRLGRLPPRTCDLPWSALGARVVLGEDLQRLWVIGDNTLTDGADSLAQLLGRHDPKLAAIELLDEHGRARRVTVRFELAGDRNHVAVADATDLDDLHSTSIHADIPRLPPPPSFR